MALNLGQAAPVAATLTPIYTCPAGKVAAGLSLVICNRGANVQSFRIAHAVAGAADDVKQYLYFGQSIDANGTLVVSLPVSLAAGDVLRVWNQGSVSWGLYGTES